MNGKKGSMKRTTGRRKDSGNERVERERGDGGFRKDIWSGDRRKKLLRKV
jgi:hypothetical protein